MTPKEREHASLRGSTTAVFLTQIGGALRSGKPHDGRAPDYDDWTLERRHPHVVPGSGALGLELSSMGIRVDEEAMARQLKLAGCEERKNLPFHRMLLSGQLPLTIGGGIGQSRLCMLMIGTCHIGEVQASLWDSDTLARCEKAGIILL